MQKITELKVGDVVEGYTVFGNKLYEGTVASVGICSSWITPTRITPRGKKVLAASHKYGNDIAIKKTNKGFWCCEYKIGWLYKKIINWKNKLEGL